MRWAALAGSILAAACGGRAPTELDRSRQGPVDGGASGRGGDAHPGAVRDAEAPGPDAARPAIDGGASDVLVPDAPVPDAAAGDDGATGAEGSPDAADAASHDAALVRDLTALEGVYDLRFGAASVPSTFDCSSIFPDSQARFHFGDTASCARKKEPCVPWALEEPGLYGRKLQADTLAVEKDRVVLFGFDERYAGHAAVTESVEELSLWTNDAGFTGQGTATLRRSCPDGQEQEIVYDVPVTIGPDETPPVIFARPTPLLAPYMVSWGEFQIDATEPAGISHGDDLTQVLGLEALSTSAQPALSPITSMWFAFGIDDPVEVSGTPHRLFLKQPLADDAGNAAVASDQPVSFAADQFIDGVLDFDDTEPSAGVGHIEYYPPGASGSPCESGGCLVLGPVIPCHQHDGATFFSIRFASAAHVNVRLRLRIDASAVFLGGMPVFIDDLQYIEAGLLYGQPLMEQDWGGELPFSTGFHDIEFPTQSLVARGGALGFSCWNYGDYESVRVVVERIEIVPDGA